MNEPWVERFKNLQKRYKFGLCSECRQPKTDGSQCQVCNDQHSQNNFKNLTSGSFDIDQLIQNQQLNNLYIEDEYWLKGSAISDSKEIVLKSLNNSQNVTADFLQEITCNKLVNTDLGSIAQCYGISQDPKTKNYLMVMDYIKGGNLRYYLNKNCNKLQLELKLLQMHTIAKGLSEIHKVGLIHRDFHVGNILVNVIHNVGLAREICAGLQIKEEGKEISRQCKPVLDAEKKKLCKRLSELYKQYKEQSREIEPEESEKVKQDLFSEFCRQNNYEEDNYFYGTKKSRDEFDELLYPTNINKTYQTHSQAIYTSRLLDFPNLSQPQNNLSQE
ncbi:8001_t:CDS:2 [Entrophospora sp. SA101]|nr:8001_t:CDS:2 [Entrophospora sp. SA101]